MEYSEMLINWNWIGTILIYVNKTIFWIQLLADSLYRQWRIFFTFNVKNPVQDLAIVDILYKSMIWNTLKCSLIEIEFIKFQFVSTKAAFENSSDNGYSSRVVRLNQWWLAQTPPF